MHGCGSSTIKPRDSNWSRDWPAPWASLVFHLDSSSRDLSFKGVMPEPCCRVRPKSATRARKGWSLRSSYGALRTLKIGFGPERTPFPDSGLIRRESLYIIYINIPQARSQSTFFASSDDREHPAWFFSCGMWSPSDSTHLTEVQCVLAIDIPLPFLTLSYNFLHV